MGTSLQVAPISVLGFLPGHVPQILINLKPIKIEKQHKSDGFDVELLGESDSIIQVCFNFEFRFFF
eukprot:GSMAST32.ASY1.ANO1.1154.1 assembled CDS